MWVMTAGCVVFIYYVHINAFIKKSSPVNPRQVILGNKTRDVINTLYIPSKKSVLNEPVERIKTGRRGPDGPAASRPEPRLFTY